MVRRLSRVAGTALLAVGALLLVWSFVTWRSGDPLTALYTHWEQRSLQRAYERQEERFEARRATNRSPVLAPAVEASRRPLASVLSALRRDARRYRRGLEVGRPVGLLTIPKLDLRVVVVDGTDETSLKRGPGLDAATYVPGEGELTYIAGHRTTFGAPFAHIDTLRPGDRVRLDLPYARFTYSVTGHRIVDANALEVLRSEGREHLALQACHPRFFATQRYIADAKLVRVAVRDPRGGWQAYSLRNG